MAIVYIKGGTTSISSSLKTQGAYPIDSLYITEYLSDLWSQYSTKANSALVYEGLQVYISKGNQWKIYSSELGYPEFDELPEGWTYESVEGKDYRLLKTTDHKGEIWILSDKDNYKNQFLNFNPGTLKEEKIDDVISGWTKLLKDGDAPNVEISLKWSEL